MQGSNAQKMVRVAVPLAGGRFFPHFGGAREFLLVDCELPSGRAASEKHWPAPEHAPGRFPRWLSEMKVNAVVAADMGERAVKILTAAGIRTCFCGDGCEVMAAAAKCARGELPPIGPENMRCSDHEGHEREHRH